MPVDTLASTGLAPHLVQTTVAGGGGLIKGIAERIQEEVNIKAYVADDPMTCVARGAGAVLEDLDSYERVLVGLHRGSTAH